jgi:hypothetical protein
MVINGPVICLGLDAIIWYRIDPEIIIWKDLLCFNLCTILFIGGVVGIALFISKGFLSPGFATQIGSILYIVPIFLSLYLKVLEMKHTAISYGND